MKSRYRKIAAFFMHRFPSITFFSIFVLSAILNFDLKEKSTLSKKYNELRQ